MSVIINPPEPQPFPYSLFSVVKPEALSDSHMLMGVEYRSDNCYNDVHTPSITDWCTTYSSNVNLDAAGVVEGRMVRLNTTSACASPGANSDWKDAQDRALRALTRGEQTALVYALSSDLLTNADAVDASPGGVATSLPVALGAAVQQFNNLYPWRSVVWANPTAANYMADRGMLIKVGAHYETPQGHYVIVDREVRNYGPAFEAPGAGEYWLWISAVPRIFRGVAEVHGPVMVQNVYPENEYQLATISGTPTGGNFRLTFDGQQTANIAYNANAAAVQAALEALSNIEPGDVEVTGPFSDSFFIQFMGQFLQRNVPQMTATNTFTGGTSPDMTISTDVEGGALQGDNTYEVYASRPYVFDWDCAAPHAVLVDADAV